MQPTMLRAALLATSSLLALAIGTGRPAEAQVPFCSFNNTPGGVDNSGGTTCVSYNNGANSTGNVINEASGTINAPTSYPPLNAGTSTGISVVGAGTTLTGNITNAGTITAPQYGINIGAGAHGSPPTQLGVHASLTGSITNSGAIHANYGVIVRESKVGGSLVNNYNNLAPSGVGLYVTGVVANGATIGGSVINNGTIAPVNPSAGIVVSLASVGGDVSNFGTITTAGFSDIGVVNGGEVAGSIINSGTLTDTNAGDNIPIYIGEQSVGGSVVNSGSISGGYGIAITGSATGGHPGIITGNVTNSGTITAHSRDGIALFSATVEGSIINSSTISATARVGIKVTGSGVVGSASVVGAIVNSGTITARTGILIASGGVVSGGITNSGNLTGSTAAIDLTGEGAATTISQTAGTISGALKLSSLGDTVDVTGGVVNGSIVGTGSSGSVTFDTGFTGTYGGSPSIAITGIGVLTVNAGTVILDATSNSDTATHINGGMLMIGDATHSNAVLTDPPSGALVTGGTLAGYGTFIGNVSNSGGIVQPGGTLGTIGTLHVTGNFTQGAGGTTLIEVNPTTAALLAVSGTAALGGNVHIVYDPGTYTAKTYDIVHAGTVTGTYAGVVGTAPSGASQSIAYTPTDVDLILAAAGGSFTSTTSTGVFGGTSDIVFDQSFDADGTVFDYLSDMETGGDTGDTKTGLAATQPIQLAFNGGNLAQLGAVAQQLPNAIAHYGGWVRGIGNFFSANGQGGAPGYSGSGGGFLTGIDHRFGALTFGAAGGYSGTNVKQDDGSTGSVDSVRGMLYAHYTAAPQVLIDGVAGFAYDRIHTNRPISALSANAVESHNGYEENFALQAGYLAAWQGFSVIPRLGVQYLHFSEDGFSETGASGFDLTRGAAHSDSFQPVVSVTALKQVTLDNGLHVVPEFKLAFSRELLSTSQILSLTTPAGTAVAGTIVTPARNTLTLGPSITARASDQLHLYASYTAAIGLGKSLDNVVIAGARYDF